jgi:hypothetical protein
MFLILLKFIFLKIPDKCKSIDFERKYKCVFWDFDTQNWNTTGCIYTKVEDDMHRCVCNHMTHFAVLVEFNPYEDVEPKTGQKCQSCQVLLEYATYIGLSISNLCLVLTIIIYLVQIKYELC